jgi:cleavage and polyadenylation specificity factor subunit 5
LNPCRPGDALKPGEDEIEGLKLRLNQKLSPVGSDNSADGDFEIGELLGTWWRPNFETYMVL